MGKGQGNLPFFCGMLHVNPITFNALPENVFSNTLCFMKKVICLIGVFFGILCMGTMVQAAIYKNVDASPRHLNPQEDSKSITTS